jgi:hypothetical protein
MSDLFTFINEMVAKPEEFRKTKMHERGKHFFMINRLCSIGFPIQASYFNHVKINPGQAVSFWQSLLSQRYNRTPQWMYVKTSKAKEAKKAAQPVDDAVIRKYCEIHKISRRDVDDALLILGDNFAKELKNFEQLIKD